MRHRIVAASWLLLFASTASAQTAPALLPMPSAAAQVRAREMIRTVFAADYAKKAAGDRAALARVLLAGKLWHFDVNDGYRLKHDVDIAVGLVNPLDWLNVLVLLRSHGYNGPFNLDYKPPRTTSSHGVFAVSFPTAVDRFITLWEMAGEAISDPVIQEATDALKAGGGAADPRDADGVTAANRDLLTLHELIAHRLVQILLGLHRGRTYSV